jgi:hypothetical protein
MKKLYFIIIIIIVLLPGELSGQGLYRQAGVRTGVRGGLFIQVPSPAGNGNVDYQAMLGFNKNGLQLTALRIIYETAIIDISPDLYFAWGYGGHAGFIVTDHISFLGERYNFEYDRFCPIIGADGWAAAEYRFRDIPLIISINIKPYVELSIPAFVRIMPADIGISVSYVF